MNKIIQFVPTFIGRQKLCVYCIVWWFERYLHSVGV